MLIEICTGRGWKTNYILFSNLGKWMWSRQLQNIYFIAVAEIINVWCFLRGALLTFTGFAHGILTRLVSSLHLVNISVADLARNDGFNNFSHSSLYHDSHHHVIMTLVITLSWITTSSVYHESRHQSIATLVIFLSSLTSHPDYTTGLSCLISSVFHDSHHDTIMTHIIISLSWLTSSLVYHGSHHHSGKRGHW